GGAAGRYRHPGDHGQVLDRARYAEQVPTFRTCHTGRVTRLRGRAWRLGQLDEGALGRPGLLSRQFRRQCDERSHLLPEALRSLERVLDDLEGRYLSAADGRGQLKCGQLVDLGHRAPHPCHAATRLPARRSSSLHPPLSTTAGSTSALPTPTPTAPESRNSGMFVAFIPPVGTTFSSGSGARTSRR